MVAVLELDGLNQAAQDGRAWKAYKAELSAGVTDAIRATSNLRSDDARKESLQDLRHVHHVLYVADRIRNAAVKARNAVPADLQSSAELILERGAARDGRSPMEVQYATSARVNWHKLLKRLEIRTPRAHIITRRLRGLAGKEFNPSEVPVLVEQYVLSTLTALGHFVDEAARAFPEQRSILIESWHCALRHASTPKTDD